MIGRVLLVCMVFCQGCATGSLLPVEAIPPFSNALLNYLDSSAPVSRVDVVRWLGEPDREFLHGQLLVYVGLREVSHNFQLGPIPQAHIVEKHLLAVELDDQQRVVHADLIINQGCTEQGLCLEPGNGTNSSTVYGGLEAFRQIVSEGLVALDMQPGLPADGLVTPPDSCRLFIYRTQGLGYLRLQPPDSESVLTVPVDGFITLVKHQGRIVLPVEWCFSGPVFREDWNYQTVELECPAGEPVYLRLQLNHGVWRPLKFEFDQATVEAGDAEIAQRKRILID